MDPTLLSTLVQGGFAALAIYLVWDTRRESRDREAQALTREAKILADAKQREEKLISDASAREERLMGIVEQYSRRLDDVTRALACVQEELANLGAIIGR